MQLPDIQQWVHEQSDDIKRALLDLVKINTYTANKKGVDAGMDALSRLAEDLGFTVKTVNGRHRLICSGNETTKPRVMLISHMDTVFPPDGDFLEHTDLGDGFLQGPGVGDIKGGIIVGLWAMIVLGKLIDDYDVQMIVSADEEKGSPTIRDWYIDGHIGADYCIGLEPGFPQGELTPDVDLGVVYQRRGYGAYHFTINGEACHSGSPHLGVDAIESFAKRVIDFKALNDWDNGVSVTVGMAEGGISPNTVSGTMTGSVSWRFEKLADGQRIQREIEAIFDKPYVTNADTGAQDSVEYDLDTFIPPMEQSERNQKLIDIVIGEAQRLQQNVVPIARGGGSDANWTSSSGTPSICGMGAPAQDIHTTNEKIYYPGVLDRIELLASSLYRLYTE
ncbi:MAG: M20/M25/M40 family metallo-hydrolase [Phototrophicaceae bacterium]